MARSILISKCLPSIPPYSADSDGASAPAATGFSAFDFFAALGFVTLGSLAAAAAFFGLVDLALGFV
jgi:hypothetical protein